MKIMKVLDKKVGSTKYTKYRVNLPKKVVENSKLLNKEIKARVEKEELNTLRTSVREFLIIPS